MEKNKRILHCLLGSIILILLNHPVAFNVVSYTRYIGHILGDILNLISLIGVILTIIFSFILIKENYRYKEK